MTFFQDCHDATHIFQAIRAEFNLNTVNCGAGFGVAQLRRQEIFDNCQLSSFNRSKLGATTLFI